MLTIQEIKEKKVWDDFLTKNELGMYPLFQSWNWGEVQKKMNADVVRLGLFENDELMGVCQIVVVRARRGHYLHLRHGPVVSPFSETLFDFFIDYIKKLGQEKNVSFIRLSPLLPKDPIIMRFFESKKYVNAPIHNMDAETCWTLFLDKTEDELLMNMRKSHRYLIKKAPEFNLKIVRAKSLQHMSSFLRLYADLSSRKHFIPHRGVKDEMEIFGKDDEALMMLAKFEEKIIAGVIILFVGDMAIYHHGASASSYRHVPASYVLQWEAIKEAKKRGKKLYNFWGIAPTESKKHPWAGLTLFKQGFGGEVREFIHAHDIPLKSLYWKTYAIEYISKILKGY